MGIASLVLGIIGFFIGLTFFKDLSLILAFLGLVLGGIGIFKSKSRGIAIAGTVICVISLVVCFATGNDGDKKAKEKVTEVVTEVNEKGEVVTSFKSKNEGNDKKEEKAEYEIGKSTVKVRTDSIGSVYADIVIPVKNTGKVNLKLGSSKADIENSEGGLEDNVEYLTAYPKILKPGETAYYYESFLYEGNEKTGLKLVPNLDITEADDECIRFEISDVKVNENQFMGCEVIGRVQNNTDTESSYSVYVIFFDKNDNVIGRATDRFCDEIGPGEKASFNASSLDVNASEIASYEVYAYPDSLF